MKHVNSLLAVVAVAFFASMIVPGSAAKVHSEPSVALAIYADTVVTVIAVPMLYAEVESTSTAEMFDISEMFDIQDIDISTNAVGSEGMFYASRPPDERNIFYRQYVNKPLSSPALLIRNYRGEVADLFSRTLPYRA